MSVPIFESGSLTTIAKVLGDTDDGLSGDEIGQLLAECRIEEVTNTSTKWRRVFNELVQVQNATQSGAHIVGFINKAVNPTRHTTNPARYRFFVDKLIPVLSLSGLTINEQGKVAKASKAASLNDALARATSLKSELERRQAHAAVLTSCRAELVVDNYYHAVFEAMKGIGDRLREMSGLTTDGAELVQSMFSLGSANTPMFALNSLANDSFVSEQRGFVNLLVGMFGMFRNPLAHEPRLSWPMTEGDALDMMSTMSLVHRKLDRAQRKR